MTDPAPDVAPAPRWAAPLPVASRIAPPAEVGRGVVYAIVIGMGLIGVAILSVLVYLTRTPSP